MSNSTDELFKSSAYLTDAYLLNDISKHSTLISAAPFNLAFGTEGQFFNWLDEKGNEIRLKRFGHAMTGTAGYEDGGGINQPGGEEDSKIPLGYGLLTTFQGFNWAALAEGSLIVDVGGGIGSTSMTLAKAFPHLRFCIQDRPKTVELGVAVSEPPLPCSCPLIKTTQAWKERCPEMLESGKVVFQGFRSAYPRCKTTYPHLDSPRLFYPATCQKCSGIPTTSDHTRLARRVSHPHFVAVAACSQFTDQAHPCGLRPAVCMRGSHWRYWRCKNHGTTIERTSAEPRESKCERILA